MKILNGHDDMAPAHVDMQYCDLLIEIEKY